MNLGELVEAVRQRTGTNADDAVLDGPTMRAFITSAIHAIEMEHDWWWLQEVATFTTAAGTDTYTPPSGWARTLSLRLSDDDEQLPYVSMETADADYGVSTDRGRPQAWTMFGTDLVLRPVPDGAYTLEHRYQSLETVLATDNDVLSMPVRFHDAIVEMAASLVWRRLGDLTRASAAAQAYQGWAGRMADDRRRGQRPKVRVRWL